MTMCFRITTKTESPDNVDTDDDNDGIPDTEEQGIGTNPLNPDTDGDGVQDGTEVGKTSAGPDSFGGPDLLPTGC